MPDNTKYSFSSDLGRYRQRLDLVNSGNANPDGFNTAYLDYPWENPQRQRDLEYEIQRRMGDERRYMEQQLAEVKERARFEAAMEAGIPYRPELVIRRLTDYSPVPVMASAPKKPTTVETLERLPRRIDLDSE